MENVSLLAETEDCSHQTFFAMKIWINEFLQDAAFPAVVLALACAPINNKIPNLNSQRPLIVAPESMTKSASQQNPKN